jgi:hypothetical protein
MARYTQESASYLRAGAVRWVEVKLFWVVAASPYNNQSASLVSTYARLSNNHEPRAREELFLSLHGRTARLTQPGHLYRYDSLNAVF